MGIKMSVLSTLYHQLQYPSIMVLLVVVVSSKIVFAAPKPPGNLTVDGNNALNSNECLNMNPNWLFCSGFEEGNKDIWDNLVKPIPDELVLLMVEPGPLNVVNNHVARFRVPAGRGGTGLVKLLPQQYDRVYARWYMKWENGYDFTAPNHGGGLHAGSRWNLGRSGNRPAGDDWFSAWLEPITSIPKLNAYVYYRGMYMDCTNPNGSCWGDHFPRIEQQLTNSNPELNAGTWYCIEMMMDAGTPVASGENADGRLNFWINNQEIGSWNNMWFRTTSDLKISLLWLSLFHHGEHSVEGIYYDNAVVSTQRIGCM